MPTPPRSTPTLPTFLVIGAQKAGTTAMHAYLRSHRETFMSRPKELKFFSADQNWSRGLEWYAESFAEAEGMQGIGESCPDYTRCTVFPGVPERIASVLPDVKLVYLVREPLERIRSAYQHAVSQGAERGAFEDVVRTVPWYIDDSRYSMQIDRYLAVFPPEQLLVLSNEALRERRLETLGRVADFIGIDPAGFDSRRVEMEVYASRERRVPGLAVSHFSRSRWSNALRRTVPTAFRRHLRTRGERPFESAELRLSPETAHWVKVQLADDHRRLVSQVPEVAAWF